MKKVLVALSGGVDSSVSALLLKEQGYDVSTAYIKTWINEEDDDLFADCPWEEDIKFARETANLLNLPFEVVNLIKDYKERVVQYLVDGYKNGFTPNPDVMCNREMKFGVFLDYALKNGFDYVATGHYCRKIENSDGSFDILEGADKNKDQSYFLALVTQDQLKHALFPVGDLLKPKVREIAALNKLPSANKKDSQGICFLGKIPINKFLEKFIEDRPGEIVNIAGKVLGRHQGLHRFTLGQRKGIGVPSNTDYENYVVIAKDYGTNQLVIAFENLQAPGLYTTQINIRNISYTNKAIQKAVEILAKPRYRDPSQKIKFIPQENDCACISFESPQRALAKGQVLALYDGDKLLGGGFFESSSAFFESSSV